MRLVRLLLRKFRRYRGGWGLNSRMAELLVAFYPNSGNWQQMARLVFTGVGQFPDQLSEIRAQWGGVDPPRYEESWSSDLAANLGRAFETFGSDKTRNSYQELYAAILGETLNSGRTSPIHVLEIGIGSQDPTTVSTMAWASSTSGGSLRAFASLSDRVEVLGLDNDRGSFFEEERITTRFVDQLDLATFDEALKGYEEVAFDLIIDDGLHFITANLNSIRSLLPRLAPLGHMVIEDIPERSISAWKVVATELSNLGFQVLFWSYKNGINVVIRSRAFESE